MGIQSRWKRLATVWMLIVSWTGVFAGSTAQAELKVYDHFDGAELDPAWDVSLDLVTDWTYEVASSWLTVSDIQFESMHGGWSTVSLSQEFEPLGDFTVVLDLAWDSEESNNAMQNIKVGLYDGAGESVVWASYHDAWDANRGRVTTAIGASVYDGPNTLPHSGIGCFEIVRSAGQVTISWNGGEVQAGTTESPIRQLELQFQAGAWPTALFGELAVDLVSCDGDEVTSSGDRSTWGQLKALYR